MSIVYNNPLSYFSKYFCHGEQIVLQNYFQKNSFSLLTFRPLVGIMFLKATDKPSQNSKPGDSGKGV